MTRPKVAVGSLGGTITMTPGDSGAVLPRLGAEQLLAVVPGLDAEIELVGETLARLPGASLRPMEIVGALDWAHAQVVSGCAGVVLVQGTDTLPETAYLADLYWPHPEPLVFTGSMRPPSALSADGPANLATACRVAGSPDARELGVTVVLDQQIHLAARVAKSHSWQLGAFTSGPFGIAGTVREDLVEVVAPRRATHPPVPRPVSDPEVAVWTTYLGDTGVSVSQLADHSVAGVVVDGYGVGHVSERLADVLGQVAESVPVVVSSSTGYGGTFKRTYGFPGSETDLLERGVLLAGALSARKARLLLWAWLAAGADREAVRAAFS